MHVRPVEGERFRSIPYGDSGISVEVDLEDPWLQHYRDRYQSDGQFVSYIAYLADAHYRGYASGRLCSKLFGHLRVGFRENGRTAYKSASPSTRPVILHTLPAVKSPNTRSSGSWDLPPPPPLESITTADDLCKYWGIGVTEMPNSGS
uniref:GNAT family N-acetyltransferase n=1 Tax=Steinernema glaseri TaxID=37863 RepID=A0A1I7YKE2_9BILA